MREGDATFVGSLYQQGQEGHSRCPRFEQNMVRESGIGKTIIMCNALADVMCGFVL